MRRRGRIVARAGAGRAVVELDADPGCARCARGRGCGAALFSPRPGPLRLDCEVPARLRTAEDEAGGRLAPGRRVTVEIDTRGSAWLRPVLLAYGLPTLGLLGGAFAPEPWTPLASLAGLAGGLLAWRVVAAHDASGSPGAGAATGRAGAAPLASGPCPRGARIASVDHPESPGEPS